MPRTARPRLVALVRLGRALFGRALFGRALFGRALFGRALFGLVLLAPVLVGPVVVGSAHAQTSRVQTPPVQTPPLQTPAPASPTDLPLDQIRVGDVGYGLTAGPAGIERFEVVVLGVREPTGPGFATILVRASGPFLDEIGGVAAGMSGSPIRIGPPGEERLAGALAYAFPDSDHRLALVTPIAAMRALADTGRGPATPPGGGAEPLATPLLLTGIGARGRAHLEPILARRGGWTLPVQAGGPGQLRSDGGEQPPAPGSAVGIALARGDVGVAAVGTVTDVRGDEVLLLGHPLLRAGQVDLALLPAEVTAIVPSRELPFKLANVGREPSGTVLRDGQAGLFARTDAVPGGLPVTVRVDGEEGARTVTARIAEDPQLAPALLAVVVQQAVDGVRDRVGGGSAEIVWEIAFRDEPPIRLFDQRVHDRDLGTEVARLAAAPLAVLLDNPFRSPGLARVSVRVEVEERSLDAELVEIALETPEVDPGGTVVAFVRVQPFRGEAQVRTVSVPVPDDVEPGPLRLTFRGAAVRDPEEEEREPVRDPLRQATSGLPPVISWGELLAALEDRPQARELIVEIPGARRARRLAREDLGTVVTGLERVTVQVRDVGEASAPGDDGEASAGEMGSEAP